MGLRGIFNKLIGRRIDKINPESGETKLTQAVKNGDVSRVRQLLLGGADPDVPNKKHLSPLHLAAYWGDIDIVQILLRWEANPNIDNGRGWTPLHSAGISGGMRTRSDIVSALKKAGAKDDIKDKFGWTSADYNTLWDKDRHLAADKLKSFFIPPNDNAPEDTKDKMLCRRCGEFKKSVCGPAGPKH